MIATVKTPDWTAELDSTGQWSCADKNIERYLNVRFGVEEIPPSPSAGKSEYAGQARAAAEKFGVEVEWPDDDEGDGRIH